MANVFPFGLRRSSCRFGHGVDVHQRKTGVLEKGLARVGQLDAANTPREQVNPDVSLEVADLPAQGRL